jgi:hypothetical protein
VSEIGRELGVRRATVSAWLAAPEYSDGRGWKGGKRSHTDGEEARVVAIKGAMAAERRYFVGAGHVRMRYSKAHPGEAVPSAWFVNDVVRRHGLQAHEPKRRGKGQGIVSRLKFPIRSIVGLGRIQQSCDFIGKKFVRGRTEPVSVFSTSYYQWLELYQIWRVLAETSEAATGCLAGLWETTPVPHVMRMDNGMTFRGTGAGEAHVGRTVKFLLNLGVKPLFSAPYQSYTNPHVEGHNRTFTEKVWGGNEFSSDDQIDRECLRFNGESREYFDFAFGERLSAKSLRYLQPGRAVPADRLQSVRGKRIYFIRFVTRWNERDRESGFTVLNRFVRLADCYLNQYVFVALDLETSTLSVLSEHDGVADEILSQPFPYTL